MSTDVEAAIAGTAARAQALLFDTKGKRKGEDLFVALFAMQTVLRVATVDQITDPQPGHILFDWKGSTLIYSAGIADLLIADATAGDGFCDRVLCSAASVMLDATEGIFDPRLRSYMCGRLNRGLPTISKRGRGQSKGKHSYRDSVIAGRLIPPLLDRFRATRNVGTKHIESACSIATKALEQVGIHMSEKRLENIWSQAFPSLRSRQIGYLTVTTYLPHWATYAS